MPRPTLHALGAVVACVAAVTVAVPAHAAATTLAAEGTIELAVTPDDAIDTMIVAAIAAARHEVLVLAYSFTNPRIARALVAAQARGVRVELVADRGQTLEQPQGVVPGLARDRIPVWIDGNFGAAHNKVIVIDADGAHATTITGSYNYTMAAQRKNAENVLILRDNPELARAYRAYFRRLQANAQRWSGEGVPAAKSAHPAR
jgi:phosphatidylserine/phosphatidylglycerophosphate/cardiolipin synthase-like enzyme